MAVVQNRAVAARGADAGVSLVAAAAVGVGVVAEQALELVLGVGKRARMRDREKKDKMPPTSHMPALTARMTLTWAAELT